MFLPFLPLFRSPVYIHLDELRPDTELMEIPFKWPSPPPPWEMLNSPLSPKNASEPEMYSPLSDLPDPCTSAEHIVPSFEAEQKFLPTVQPMQSIVRASKPSPLQINVNLEQYEESTIRFL